jgi:hypothetical protein
MIGNLQKGAQRELFSNSKKGSPSSGIKSLSGGVESTE